MSAPTGQHRRWSPGGIRQRWNNARRSSENQRHIHAFYDPVGREMRYFDFRARNGLQRVGNAFGATFRGVRTFTRYSRLAKRTVVADMPGSSLVGFWKRSRIRALRKDKNATEKDVRQAEAKLMLWAFRASYLRAMRHAGGSYIDKDWQRQFHNLTGQQFNAGRFLHVLRNDLGMRNGQIRSEMNIAQFAMGIAQERRTQMRNSTGFLGRYWRAVTPDSPHFDRNLLNLQRTVNAMQREVASPLSLSEGLAAARALGRGVREVGRSIGDLSGYVYQGAQRRWGDRPNVNGIPDPGASHGPTGTGDIRAIWRAPQAVGSGGPDAGSGPSSGQSNGYPNTNAAPETDTNSSGVVVLVNVIDSVVSVVVQPLRDAFRGRNGNGGGNGNGGSNGNGANGRAGGAGDYGRSRPAAGVDPGVRYNFDTEELDPVRLQRIAIWRQQIQAAIDAEVLSVIGRAALPNAILAGIIDEVNRQLGTDRFQPSVGARFPGIWRPSNSREGFRPEELATGRMIGRNLLSRLQYAGAPGESQLAVLSDFYKAVAVLGSQSWPDALPDRVEYNASAPQQPQWRQDSEDRRAARWDRREARAGQIAAGKGNLWQRYFSQYAPEEPAKPEVGLGERFQRAKQRFDDWRWGTKPDPQYKANIGGRLELTQHPAAGPAEGPQGPDGDGPSSGPQGGPADGPTSGPQQNPDGDGPASGPQGRPDGDGPTFGPQGGPAEGPTSGPQQNPDADGPTSGPRGISDDGLNSGPANGPTSDPESAPAAAPDGEQAGIGSGRQQRPGSVEDDPSGGPEKRDRPTGIDDDSSPASAEWKPSAPPRGPGESPFPAPPGAVEGANSAAQERAGSVSGYVREAWGHTGGKSDAPTSEPSQPTAVPADSSRPVTAPTEIPRPTPAPDAMDSPTPAPTGVEPDAHTLLRGSDADRVPTQERGTSSPGEFEDDSVLVTPTTSRGQRPSSAGTSVGDVGDKQGEVEGDSAAKLERDHNQAGLSIGDTFNLRPGKGPNRT